MISTTFMGEFEDWKEKFETDPDGNTEYTSKEDTELLCQVGQALASKFKVEGNPKEYNTLQEAQKEACKKAIDDNKPTTIYIVRPYTTISIQENMHCQ